MAEQRAYAAFVEKAALGPVRAADLTKAAKEAGLTEFSTVTAWNRALYAWQRSSCATKTEDDDDKPLWQPTSVPVAIHGIRQTYLEPLLHALSVLGANGRGTADERAVVAVLAERVQRVDARFAEADVMFTNAAK